MGCILAEDWLKCSSFSLLYSGITVNYCGLIDAINWIIDNHLKRRHLNESQRAVIAARLANINNGENQYTKLGSANLRTLINQSQAAEMLTVSPRTIRTVKAIEREAMLQLKHR